MKHGDISNLQSPIIAFNMDNLLFSNKEPKGIVEKMKNHIRTEKQRYFYRELDNVFIGELKRVWDAGFCVYLITFTEWKKDIQNMLNDKLIMYTRVVQVSDFEYLNRECFLHYSLYVDSDWDNLIKIDRVNTCHIDNYKERMWEQHE